MLRLWSASFRAVLHHGEKNIGLRDALDELAHSSVQRSTVSCRSESHLPFDCRCPSSLESSDDREAGRTAFGGQRGGLLQSLKLLKPGNAGGPTMFFFVHDARRTSCCLSTLARRIPADVTVHAFRNRLRRSLPVTASTFLRWRPIMSSRCAKRVPHGPLFLGGLVRSGDHAFVKDVRFSCNWRRTNRWAWLRCSIAGRYTGREATVLRHPTPLEDFRIPASKVRHHQRGHWQIVPTFPPSAAYRESSSHQKGLVLYPARFGTLDHVRD